MLGYLYSSPVSSLLKTSNASSHHQETDGSSDNPEDPDDPDYVLEAESVDMAFWEHPEDCFAPWFWNRVSPLFKGVLDSKVGAAWRRLRQSCYHIVENRYFESFIFLMIIISSGTLVSTLMDRYLMSSCIVTAQGEFLAMSGQA